MDEIPNISGFNYRIARHKVGDDAYYRIHECFYDENGRVVLWGESSPHSETADALIADWSRCSLTPSVLGTTSLMFLQINRRPVDPLNPFYCFCKNQQTSSLTFVR
jgi:hypothetical protein